jgi:hypothetical protein
MEVVVEGTTWESWGAALVGRTGTGELLTFPVSAAGDHVPHAGEEVVLAVRHEARIT